MLGVLDGAVLVVSAVEGVQPQTRVLMRALRRLGSRRCCSSTRSTAAAPTRTRVVEEIAAKLTPAVVPMSAVRRRRHPRRAARPYAATPRCRPGCSASCPHRTTRCWPRTSRTGRVPFGRLRSRPGRADPAGAGAPGVLRLGDHRGRRGRADRGDRRRCCRRQPATRTPRCPAPCSRSSAARPARRSRYVRMFDGTLQVRDRLAGDAEGHRHRRVRPRRRRGPPVRPRGTDRQAVGAAGGADRRPGRRRAHRTRPSTSRRRRWRPSWSRRRGERGRLQAALSQLAEQDPLIDLRQDDVRQELYVSLYGEVQKEVIEATLADEYGLAVTFRETTTICVERPAGSGSAYELMGEGNPFLATVGLRVGAGPGRQRHRVPARGRARFDAVRVLPHGRGHRPGDPGAGPVRLAGRRLRGHDDALRVLRRGRATRTRASTRACRARAGTSAG